MTTKKCPKCSSRYFQLVDYCATRYIYEIVNGVVYAEGANDGEKSISTTCICRICGHQWHPRNLDNAFKIDY